MKSWASMTSSGSSARAIVFNAQAPQPQPGAGESCASVGLSALHTARIGSQPGQPSGSHGQFNDRS
jgi:hypothetical protein